MNQRNTTDFGYQQVPIEEKAHKVADVFSSVADRYDIMNDLMSFGVHRLWKRFAIELANVHPGERILDLAGGTGDLAARLAPKVKDKGEVMLVDINAAMLEQSRERLMDLGVTGNVRFTQANAENLPFPDRHFNLVTIAFTLGARGADSRPGRRHRRSGRSPCS